jgi:hypothetical protein
MQVWQMPGAPELHHIVVPDPALNPPRRLDKQPVATVAPGESMTITIGKPDAGPQAP